MQTQRQYNDVLSKRKPKSSAKNLSNALQTVNNTLENKVGIHDSRRPSKPNLLNAPKPSKLLALTGLRRTLSSLACRISQSPIVLTKMNWSLPNYFPSTKILSHIYGYGEIRIWLMYLSMM